MFFRQLHYFLTHSPEREAARFGVRMDSYRAMRRALWKCGMYYEEFCLFDCAGRDEAYLSSFITELNRYEIYRRYNDPHDLPLFHDKYRVYQLYRDYYRREVVPVYSRRDRDRFLAFVRRHPRFVVKPADKSCGFGVRFADSTGQSPEQLFDSLRTSGRQICEEPVIPHPDLARLNPTSLNTVRVVTVLRADGVTLFHPFLRVGRYGSEVDNGGAGGILIPVNPLTGALARTGRDETGRYYTAHPDSHVRFGGITLPMWDEAVHLAEMLAAVRPGNRCVGWDIAAAPDGWVMIEANIRGQFIGQQMCDRTGKRRELI